MDPNNQNPQQPQTLPVQPVAPSATPDISSLIPAEQTQALFKELHLQNLPPEKKEEMLNTMIDTVMDRIFLRIEPQLSPESRQHLEELETKPGADQELVQYLVSAIPNLDQIAQEEINTYKGELKLQIDTIIQTLDQEAAKLPDTQTLPPQPLQPLPSPQPTVLAGIPPVNVPQNVITDTSQMSEALGAPNSDVPAQTSADIVQPLN